MIPKSMRCLRKNNRKSLLRPPFWHAFGSWSLSVDALETILGWGPQKTQKDHLGDLSSWSIFVSFLWYFCGDDFCTFSEPLSFHLCATIDTHRIQFRRLLATKFGTDWANLEKWKQWFRVRGSIKIKPQWTSICTDCVISMYICSKPVFFVILDLSLSHSFKLWYPFAVHFGQ